MKSTIIKEHIETHSPEWYAYRLNYVNSSEMGAILNLDPYAPAAKVFCEKIGKIPQWTDGNANTYWGLAIQDAIAEAWSYYDPNQEDSYVKNKREKNQLRKYRAFRGYYRNPKYPWLSVSLDYLMMKFQFNLIDRNKNPEEAPIEVKNMNAYALNKWEAIPVQHLVQLTTQLLVLELPYGELCIKDSNNNMHVWPVEYNKELAEQIIEQSKIFWDKVQLAKDLSSQMLKETDPGKLADLQFQIDQLEPPPDGSKAYEAFIKEKYKDSHVPDEKNGTDEDMANAKEYLNENEQAKEVEERKQIVKNKILHSLGKHEIITFGEEGKITYFASKTGARSLRVNIKAIKTF